MKLFSSLRYFISTLSLLILITLSPQLSYGDETNEGVKSSCAGVDCLIGGYGAKVLKQLTALPSDTPITIDTWPAQSIFFKTPTAPNTILDSKKALDNLFSSTGNDDIQKSANLLYAFNFTGGTSCPNPNTSSANEACKTSADKSLNNINFNTFFGPLTYDETQQTAAMNFLQLSALTTQPFSLKDIAGILKDKNEFNPTSASPEYQKYLNLLRVYATVQSTALSNLYQFYNERLPFATPQKDSNGKEIAVDSKVTAALKALNLDAKKTSPLQLENYMATHRMAEMGTGENQNKPKWVLDLANNNPAQLQRQLLILQAENLAETHRLRMSIDRLTATMSMMMLQNSYNTRQQLESVASGIKPPASQS